MKGQKEENVIDLWVKLFPFMITERLLDMRSKKQYSTEMRERKSKEIRNLKVMMTVFNLLFYPFTSTLSHFSFPLLSCSIYFMFMFHSCDFKIFIGSSTNYDFFLIAVLVHDYVGLFLKMTISRINRASIHRCSF